MLSDDESRYDKNPHGGSEGHDAKPWTLNLWFVRLVIQPWKSFKGNKRQLAITQLNTEHISSLHVLSYLRIII